MKKHIYLILISLLSTTAWAATTFTIDRGSSSAEFLAIGRPSALKIRGTKGKPEGKLTIEEEKIQGELLLNLSEFETGIGMRDRHMKEKYLEVEKNDFKVAKLKIISVSLPLTFWKSPSKQKTSFKGLLKLHGVEKEIAGDIDITDATKDSLSGSANFTIALPDFGITIPSFSGITVAEKVDVEVKFKGKVESL